MVNDRSHVSSSEHGSSRPPPTSVEGIEIAMKLGIDKTAMVRVRAGISYA